MSISTAYPSTSFTPTVVVPKLQAGDQLTAAEFLRRYHAMPEIKKAELIEGRVFMPSPVRNDQHAEPHSDLMTWLGLYRYNTHGVATADNATVQLDVDNVPQPDGLLRILPECGGNARTEGGYLIGGCELHAEVAASSVSYDLHDKMNAYRRNGVQEYVVWRVEERAIDWFVLHEGRYDRLPPDADGIYRSRVLPGLWLDSAAMIAGNFKRVQEVIHQGIASPEHQHFVAALKERKGS